MTTDRRGKPDNTVTTAPRKRALVSCDRCKLRRARCIRDNPDAPCADCKISGVACESKLPRKQRVYGSVETLSLRYRALDALVKGLFPQDSTQDVNALFRIAAARDIAMPAVDDYTPADIFNNTKSGTKQPTTPQREQHQYHHHHHHQHQPAPTSPGLPHASLAAQSTEPSLQHVEATSASLTRDSPSESQQPRRPAEQLLTTRPGAPYRFGPSSSFRLAMAFRMLVARYQVIPGVRLPRLPESISSYYDGGSKAARSLRPGSTNPSDDECLYNHIEVSDLSRIGRKRSRALMEETSDRWEHREGSPNPDIIGDLLPSRSLADALVAVYFDQINVHLPLFYRSMFQFRLEATYSRKTERLKECADIGWLVALALVFSFGCQQLQEHDPEQAHKLRLKYLGFAKSYFRHVLMDTCLINVQALVLFNLHFHTVGQKSTSWSVIGLAARMAIAMSMHRDGSNLDFEPMEQNTRRQVFWIIYTIEKSLCSILGYPTAIDDTELHLQVPDAPMQEDMAMSPEFMATTFKLTRMSYTIRQGAYFDRTSKEERSPSLGTATLLLQQCDAFFATIPPSLTLDFSPVLSEQRGRILLLHVYYYYTRCIVSRDFLTQKVERNICYLESKPPPHNEDWHTTLLLSEDCVDSAHQVLNCILEGSHLSMINYSWLDLFYVFHSILIVCADFLARPQQQIDSAKDVERRDVVRAALAYVRGLKKQAPTCKTLSQIAEQFAGMTGVADEEFYASQPLSGGETGSAHGISEISDIHEDWFASATMDLGLDFHDLAQATRSVPPYLPGSADQNGGQTYGYLETHPVLGEVGDWTTRTLKGLHSI